MADGSTAIASAIQGLSGMRTGETDEYKLELRCCFAHVIRMGGTRGGGIRGGKGSLARYLLDQGVPPKVMTKMMVLIIMFNYIPDHVVFKEAMNLFIEDFKEYINEHLKDFYLDPTNPNKLGGRAVGQQGQTGSNQGGKIRGGNIKKNTSNWLREWCMKITLTSFI